MLVITSPTGQIGRQVLDRVLDHGEPIRVIARDPGRLPTRVRESVEVVQGSHADPDVVDHAFAGADAVFWLVPSDPRATSLEAAYPEFTRPACDAFKNQEVERVVGISAFGRGVTDNAGHVSASLAMDDLIASTGVSYRALIMPSFMDNLLWQIEAMKNQGAFFSPLCADRKVPACATRDIASVAATLLLDSNWSGVDSVPVLGPEDLSLNDMAQIISEVLGRPIRCQRIPFDAYKAQFRDQGMSEAMAQGMVDMMQAKNAGLDNTEPRTPQASTPTSFRQWCQEVLKPAVLA
jgi:uncharacterized protein YbjT (DUF2867 family)